MSPPDSYDDRPGVAERYSTAIESSNLRVKADQGGAADLLIAAGWCSDTLGATLWRLRADYDSVAADVRRTADNDDTARTLILIHLGSPLKVAKVMLGNLALKQGGHHAPEIAEQDLRNIAGRCLEAFLDPNCRPCEGRGFNGGGRHEHTGPQVICKRCKGLGKRSGAIGKTDQERAFGNRLLYEMERATSNAEQNMKNRLHNPH